MDRYTKITYKGKIQYIWDKKGKYIREDNKFVILEDGDVDVKKELAKILKSNPYIKNRIKGIKDLNKKLYYAKVWWITESNDLTVLKNHKRRKFRGGFHLDHIFCIICGYKNNIPPEAIGHIDNLRFIPYKLNMRKRDLITEETQKIINKIIVKLNIKN